jgi:hypothetical protein
VCFLLSATTKRTRQDKTSWLTLLFLSRFAVYPKHDCPHVANLFLDEIVVDCDLPCSDCGDTRSVTGAVLLVCAADMAAMQRELDVFDLQQSVLQSLCQGSHGRTRVQQG